MTKSDGELTRLRDVEVANGTTEADLAALVRAGVGGGPRLGSKARVRAALLTRRTPSRAAWLRPVVVVSLLLVAGAGARAARGPGLGQTLRRLVSWVAPAAVPPVTVAPHAAETAPRVATPTEAPSAPAAISPSIAPEVRPAARPAHHVGRSASATAPIAASPTSDEEPTLVAAAVRALRRDHDAARAGTLLDEYLRRWPTGALAEEALALSIEAAQASGGTTRTRALAVRYLQRFPSGRFVETAHRALVPAAAP